MRRLVYADLERLRIPIRYRESSMDMVTEPVLLEYLRMLGDHIRVGRGLYLYGRNGVGKTAFSCLALMQARRLGFLGLFVESAKIREYLFEHTSYDGESTMWERMHRVDLLVIDDFGKERGDRQGWEKQMLDEILRNRMMNCRATILTSNVVKDRLLVDDLMMRSTVEALMDSTIAYELRGENMRKEHAAENRAALGLDE